MKRTLKVYEGYTFASGDGDNFGTFEIKKHHSYKTYDCTLHLLDDDGFETGETEQHYLTESDILGRLRDQGEMYNSITFEGEDE